MVNTRLILLEGLPSTGKSTNADFLRMILERNGVSVKWVHEVAQPHPTSFFNEAGFFNHEYEKFIKNYPESADILNNAAIRRTNTVCVDLSEIEWKHMKSFGGDAFQALKEFDTWIFPIEKYVGFALDKWRHFADEIVKNKNTTYIMDSAVFQYPVFAFIFENKPYNELECYVHKVFKIIETLNPCLIYFYREDISNTINYLEKDRGIAYLDWMGERDKLQPYYKDKPKGAAGFKLFLKDYGYFADLLFESVNCTKLSVEITRGNWEEYENRMCSFLCVDNLSSPAAYPPAGIYINKEFGYKLNVSGLSVIDPVGKTRKLTPKNENEFYMGLLPVTIIFLESERLTISGVKINAHWTETGTIFEKIRT